MSSCHLLSMEDLTLPTLLSLLDNSESFVEVLSRDIKKVPSLRGKSVINVFLEPSTRTRTSFELAGKRLSADTINISASGSSLEKGESLLDTMETIAAMRPDIVVLRHKASGAHQFLASRLSGTSIVNAGDGAHEHPTQALLDLLTLKRHLPRNDSRSSLMGLRVSIVGDILHSRVVRSALIAHRMLCNEVRLVGPPPLVPRMFVCPKLFGHNVSVVHRLDEGIKEADVIMCLRIQHERQNGRYLSTLDDYARHFCVTERVLQEHAPHCVVLHPGPANRGIEISAEVADGHRALIRNQVENGVAVRMAVLLWLASGGSSRMKEAT
jgi:aspartate carbamoyltransferase catalytic subunit